jgi:hypothetical protein
MADTDVLSTVPTVRSMRQWKVSKETADGKIPGDEAIGSRTGCLIPRRPAISFARARDAIEMREKCGRLTAGWSDAQTR